MSFQGTCCLHLQDRNVKHKEVVGLHVKTAGETYIKTEYICDQKLVTVRNEVQ
jgi:hypothetical protein